MKCTFTDTVIYGLLDSPVGPLLIAGDTDNVRMISFPTGSQAQDPLPDWTRDDGYYQEANQELRAYFAGELTSFGFALSFDGTPFQKSVWKALCDIPYGATASYGEIAAKIGRPKASRAVGAANRANPLPIVVPCHRVIGANASLTGFGGGLDTKQFLLALESPPPTQGRLFDPV